jgi:hypothetical protein
MFIMAHVVGVVVALMVLVQYSGRGEIINHINMTTLTIRIEEGLKARASSQADKLGVPLTLIVTNALKKFVESPRIVIGEPEMIGVTPVIQKKMDKVAKLLSEKSKK